MDHPSSETPENPTKPDLEHRIREKAFQIWQMDGSPEGREEHYWYLARDLIEAEVEAEAKASKHPPST